MSVTALASRMVLNPREYPEAIAARTVLPDRYSSRIRSKMTMFASAATPMVRMVPAMPGRVIVTGMPMMTP
jgi:hypothetical protein